MSARDHDAPTVARSVSLSATGPRELESDDAPTSVYACRALPEPASGRTGPPARARTVRPAAAMFQTMTVRAVAGLSGAVTGSAQARPGRRHPRSPLAGRATLIGVAIASWLAALIAGCWLATRLDRGSPPSPHTAPAAGATPARQPRTPAPATTTTHPTPAPPPAIPPAIPPPAVPPSAAAPGAKPRPAARSRRHTTPAVAADQLAAGDYAAALTSYAQLAGDHPDEPVYAAIVQMLERDLARRCDPTLPARDPACPP